MASKKLVVVKDLDYYLDEIQFFSLKRMKGLANLFGIRTAKQDKKTLGEAIAKYAVSHPNFWETYKGIKFD